jgi:hypothetical protein
MQSDHIMDIPSKYFEFLDDRPLTDETLEEMGFWEDEEIPGFWFYEVKKIYNDVIDNDCQVLIFGNSNDSEAYLWEIGDRLDSPRWFTVGSVKMLIETLKGDKERK